MVRTRNFLLCQHWKNNNGSQGRKRKRKRKRRKFSFHSLVGLFFLFLVALLTHSPLQRAHRSTFLSDEVEGGGGGGGGREAKLVPKDPIPHFPLPPSSSSKQAICGCTKEDFFAYVSFPPPLFGCFLLKSCCDKEEEEEEAWIDMCPSLREGFSPFNPTIHPQEEEAQPPTLVCKMEDQSEYMHIAHTFFLHVWRPFACSVGDH